MKTLDTRMHLTRLAIEDKPMLVTWCPGNGTRYDMLFLQFAEPVHGAGRFGRISTGGWLVVCSLTGQACLLQGHGALDPGYVANKLALESMVDARVVTEMIARVTGRPVLGRAVEDEAADEAVDEDEAAETEAADEAAESA